MMFLGSTYYNYARIDVLGSTYYNYACIDVLARINIL